MRCLVCKTNDLPPNTETCPQCRAFLSLLMSDLLPTGKELGAGRYRIDHPLGRGRFGVTYRGARLLTGKAVAIKEFFPSHHAQRDDVDGSLLTLGRDGEKFRRGLKQFMRDGLMLADIEHSHVVRVHDCFEELGTAYLVMELVEGRTLREELEAAGGSGARGLPESRVRRLMEQLVSALEAIHVKGLCHLDI